MWLRKKTSEDECEKNIPSIDWRSFCCGEPLGYITKRVWFWIPKCQFLKSLQVNGIQRHWKLFFAFAKSRDSKNYVNLKFTLLCPKAGADEWEARDRWAIAMIKIMQTSMRYKTERRWHRNLKLKQNKRKKWNCPPWDEMWCADELA